MAKECYEYLARIAKHGGDAKQSRASDIYIYIYLDGIDGGGGGGGAGGVVKAVMIILHNQYKMYLFTTQRLNRHLAQVMR